MQATDSLSCTVWESGGLWVAWRVKGNLGVPITQASLVSASYSVWNLTNNNAVVVASTPLTIAAVVFDTYQTTDPRWTIDATGYNFAVSLPTTCFPAPGGQDVQIEIVLTPPSGAPLYLAVKAHVRDLLSV